MERPNWNRRIAANAPTPFTQEQPQYQTMQDQQYAPVQLPQYQAMQDQQYAPIPQPQYQAMQDQQSDSSTSEPIFGNKIYKINGMKKVIDFNAKFSVPLDQDFMMVHGCGGSNHARSSAIELKICDYANASRGGKSTTVVATIKVADIDMLYHAAMGAVTGSLHPQAPSVGWIQSCKAEMDAIRNCMRTNDGQYIVPPTALNNILNILTSAEADTSGTTPGKVLFNYNREVNYGSFGVNEKGMAAVKSLVINYTPIRQDGKIADYPWFIGIKNYDAPIKVYDTGATTHSRRNAQNMHEANICLSTNDFAAAMTAVRNTIRLWESVVSASVMQRGWQKHLEEHTQRRGRN